MYTLTETVKGGKQPHPPLEQWSLPPPGTAQYTRQTIACRRRYERKTYYQISRVSATNPNTHKNALSDHELTNAEVQGRLVSRYAGNDTVSERHRPETRQYGVEGDMYQLHPGGVASRVSGQGVAVTTYIKGPARGSVANHHGRSQ